MDTIPAKEWDFGSGGAYRIFSVHPSRDTLPLGLGMVLAYGLTQLPAGQFDLGPRFISSPDELPRLISPGNKNILLCSNYFWNTEKNIQISRAAKRLDPDCRVIHGGPDTPCYPGACEAFLRHNPSIDYAVNGEGEVTFVQLMEMLAGTRHRLPAGVSTLAGHRLQRTSNRSPLKDINRFPSPYLDGLFDHLDPAIHIRATLETNRGCPYACAYCSWSHPLDSLNQHRLRLFDLDRVGEEIRWIAQKGFKRLFIADSNFGILDRDLQIAEMVLEARTRYGYPQIVTVNYAKNNHQRILKIVEILEKKKMLSDGGIISLQTRDAPTLLAIGRKNIKTREYDQLREGFKQRGLPLNVQLMMALPGATPDAFLNDLRFYFGQPVETTLYRTIMLPNSPMADPEYRKKFRIEVNENNLVCATAHTSAEEMKQLIEVGCLFDGVQNLGLLRLPLAYLAWEKGWDVIGLLWKLVRDGQSNGAMPELQSHLPPAYPDVIHMALRSKKKRHHHDWPHIHQKFRQWIKNYAEPVDNSDLSCLMQAQTLIMPDENQTYPARIELPYDVRQWYLDREQGMEMPLASYGAAEMVVFEPCYFWKRFIRKNFSKCKKGLKRPISGGVTNSPQRTYR